MMYIEANLNQEITNFCMALQANYVRNFRLTPWLSGAYIPQQVMVHLQANQTIQ